MAAERRGELANELWRLSVNLPEALAEITVPAYVLDSRGTIVWLNTAALERSIPNPRNDVASNELICAARQVAESR